MSYYEIFNTWQKGQNISYFNFFPGREETIQDLSGKFFDVVVVGGGIHGATFARLSALNGLRTALFERDDYASQTSSRSSKMAHGGLRYLELYDLPQVFEGIRAREKLFQNAGHLVKPHEFLIPVKNGDWKTRLKLGAGLTLYDLLLRDRSRKHRWTKDGYIYYDGIMNDSRIVLENIVAARQEGAVCLNYASVDNLKHSADDSHEVAWTDQRSGKKYEVRAGIVVNCAGPWAPFTGRIAPSALQKKIRYSQGAHLLFNVPWKGPALFLPLGPRGRYYFVWPHFAGTLVGTTEREITELSRDPMPTQDEVSELMGRIKKDLPGSGLTKETLHYTFAGIRTLVLRGDGSDVSKLSRKHEWSYAAGVFTLLGGKFTTAELTCAQGLRKLFSLASVTQKRATLSERKYPGYAAYGARTEEFRSEAKGRGLSDELVERAIRRYGGRCSYFNQKDECFEPVGGALLRGEIEIALHVEQAVTMEDLMRRRLDFEYMYGHGLEVLPKIGGILKAYLPSIDIEAEELQYRERMKKIKDLFREL